MKELLVDAIMGISLKWEQIKNLPKRIYTLNKEYEYKAVRSEVELYDEEELKGLYDIFKGTKESMELYDGFDPRSEEEIAYDKAYEKYIEFCKERTAKEQKMYTNVDEISDTINFGILHSMFVKGIGVMGNNNDCIAVGMKKNGIDIYRAKISKEDMETKSEGIKEQKLRDVLQTLNKRRV